MRTYIILILLIAIAIPMLIKFGINNSDLRTATSAGSGPCMINNFNNDSLQDRMLPRNLDNIQKPSAFQREVDNHPKEHMLNMEGFQNNSSDRVGQNCQFGQCIPGQQQQPGNTNE